MSTVGRNPWLRRFVLGTAALGVIWALGRASWESPARDDADSTPPGESSPKATRETTNEGLIVEAVAPGSVGDTAGIRAGDRLWEGNGETLRSPSTLQAILDNAIGEVEITLLVERDAARFEIRAPRIGFKIDARPNLSSDAAVTYEEGRSAAQNGDADSAAAKWSHAATISSRAGDRIAAAWLHTRAARMHETRQRWSEASQSYRAALDLCAPGAEDALRSRILLAQSKCRQQLADATAAVQCLEEALRLDSAANRKSWEGADLHTLGTMTWSRGDFESAARYFELAVAVRERWFPDSAQLGESLNGLGAVATQKGDLDKAEAFYRRSLAVCERAMPGSMAVADGLNNLGVVAMSRGDLDAAHQYHSRSLAIRERLAPDSDAVTAALTNLGIVEYKRGHLQAAQDYYGRSLAIHERLGADPMYVARDFVNLGVIAYERGDVDAAHDFYARGSSILERVAPDSPDCMASVFNLGLVALERGDWELAQRNLTRALEYRERTAPDSLAVAESCNALGNLAFARADLDAAEAYYLRALAIQERVAPDTLVVCVCVHNLGGIASRRGRNDDAKRYYERALAIRERLAPGSLDLANSLHGLGEVALRMNRPEEALPLLRRALDTIEAQRDHIHAIQSRAFLLARYSEPYVTLQRAYLALGDRASAFETIERARARSLLDGLGEARADIREGVEPALLAREKELQVRLSETELERQTSLNQRVDDARLDAIERTLNELLVEYEDIQGQIRRASPRYAALTQPEPLSLAEIQRDVLDPDTVLLEYALGIEASTLWLVTSDELHSYPLPAREEVDRAARRVHELATARNQSAEGESAEPKQRRVAQADADYRSAAAELSEMVLGPAAGHLGDKRLLIVADGALQYVPFAALPEPASASGHSIADPSLPATGEERPPLIVGHEIISLPSASVLAVLRRELAGRSPASKSVAVLADPVLQATDPRVTQRKDGAHSEMVDGAATSSTEKDRSRGVTRIEPASVPRLRFSRREAENILALAEDPGFGALDFAANKQAALSPELGEYRIVHLATHGLLNSQHPELSGIILSLVDERGEAQDGFLRLHEIYNLRWNADLVVLSACQTALGREVRGEGLVGLTRGFMYAGAERVVASLWSVQDKATSELMKTFYEAMFEGQQTPAAALRSAQVAMWREGRAPYYWAAFVLQGEYHGSD